MRRGLTAAALALVAAFAAAGPSAPAPAASTKSCGDLRSARGVVEDARHVVVSLTVRGYPCTARRIVARVTTSASRKLGATAKVAKVVRRKDGRVVLTFRVRTDVPIREHLGFCPDDSPSLGVRFYGVALVAGTVVSRAPADSRELSYAVEAGCNPLLGGQSFH